MSAWGSPPLLFHCTSVTPLLQLVHSYTTITTHCSFSSCLEIDSKTENGSRWFAHDLCSLDIVIDLLQLTIKQYHTKGSPPKDCTVRAVKASRRSLLPPHCQQDWQGGRAPSWGWVSCQALGCLGFLGLCPARWFRMLAWCEPLCSLSFSWLNIPKRKRTCRSETRRQLLASSHCDKSSCSSPWLCQKNRFFASCSCLDVSPWE